MNIYFDVLKKANMEKSKKAKIKDSFLQLMKEDPDRAFVIVEIAMRLTETDKRIDINFKKDVDVIVEHLYRYLEQ